MGKKLYACFVDFKKAFDSVWRLGMIYKLLKTGMNKNYVKLIQHMYEQTSQSLKINNGLSRPFETHRGVRQGCILSPRLFNLFINDLPGIFDVSCDPVWLNEHTNISCLMYADDLIILSETAEGMQNCLNRLQKYTEEWNLEVNISKTKTMVFQNGGARKTLNFKLGEQALENAQSYKYLGTIITNTGNFKMNHANIKKKGIRASFLITKNIGPYCKPSTAIKIFEKTVEPILMYNSEITCAYVPMTWTFDKFKEKIWEIGTEMNKVILGFLRQILGIGKKSTNIATHGETGKYPICIKIFTQMMKYWQRLRGEDISDLLKATTDLDRNDQMTGKQSWMRIIGYLLKFTDITPEDGPEGCKNIAKTFRQQIQTQYKKWWSIELKNTSKLDFYEKHKKQFRFEPYLDTVPKGPRVCITKLRVSSHCLPVEIQRYHKNPKRREERICPICNLGETGDEYHYLLRCRNNELCSIREKFFEKNKAEHPQFKDFTEENIINYCLNMNDVNIQKITAEYVRDLLNMYREEVDVPERPVNNTIITRAGRVIKKPQKLNL